MKNKEPDLSAKLSAIVETIDAPPLRRIISDVFTSLIDLLEHVDLLEVCLREDATLLKMHHMFRAITKNGQALISYIDSKATPAKGIPDDLCDLLDGTTFAIQHELQRITTMSNSYPDESTEQLRSKFMRAYGLLHNCFQQCVVSTARGIQPSITGAELFDDFTLLKEQSIVLVEALRVLIQQTESAESSRTLDSYFGLSEGLKMFKQGYMHYLIYRDWAEFDASSDKILEARTEFELWPLLAQFTSYLETLMGHVQMREVLQNNPLQHLLVQRESVGLLA